MTDDAPTPPADDVPGETPAQKALRLKTAKIDAGKSRPWMSK